MDKCKYENAILFFAQHVSGLGRVKLNKLLYFADFDHFEKYGTPITGDTYLNNELGPVPEHIQSILGEMQRSKKLHEFPERVYEYIRYSLQPITEANVAVFKSSEIEMLCSVASKWGAHTAKELVSASHGEAPWIASRRGEVIPYALAYYRGKYDQSELDYDSEPVSESLPIG